MADDGKPPATIDYRRASNRAEEYQKPMVSGGSEVKQVFESASHSFCQLDYPVYGLDS